MKTRRRSHRVWAVWLGTLWILGAASAPVLAEPELDRIQPEAADVGGPGFTLTAEGENFVEGSVIRWNGSDRPTTFVNDETLTAEIPASDLSARGFVTVTVFEPNENGGDESGGETFRVRLVPAVSGMSPSTAQEDTGGFTLTINGSNFASDSVVQWNGDGRNTTFVDSNTLTAEIPAGDVDNAGSFTVRVFNPDPGGFSGELTFTVTSPSTNPQPVLSSMNPASREAGGSGFTLTVTGSNFTPQSVLRWNGSDRPTTFVGSGTLTAEISADDVAVRGFASVSVFTPSPGGGVSGSQTFSINLVPAIGNLSPNSAEAGSSGFTLTVSGTGYASDSVVRWNGSDRPTRFVDANTVAAEIPSSDVALPGQQQVTVFNSAPGGESGGATFTVSGAVEINPIPVLTQITPNAGEVGGDGFVLTAQGTNFVQGSVIRWNGSDRATTFVNSNVLTAQIPAADLLSRGNAFVTVFTPSPGGGMSNAQTFTVNLVPSVSSLNPASVRPGSPSISLTVLGANFAADSVVQWNGDNRPTTFVNANTLRADIADDDLENEGAFDIRVVNSNPGGISNVRVFRVSVAGNPAPRLSSISPESAEVGGARFVLTVSGSNFVDSSVVRWNGVDRPTTFINDATLSADIPPGDLTTRGYAEITVFTPPAGGGLSEPLSFGVRLVPVIESVSPSSTTAETLNFDMTITGANFAPDSEVRWNGRPLPTVFVGSTSLTASVMSSDFTAEPVYSITVFNRDPGGTSNPFRFEAVIEPVRVYPNPWRADRHGTLAPQVIFDRLNPGSEVKIFTLSGRWVKTLYSTGGTASWDLTSDSGQSVSSGFYLYYVTGINGRNRRGKVAVIK
jgi:hypothetical protein